MKYKIFFSTILSLLSTISFEQTIKRIDGTQIEVDSLHAKIDYLIKTANVSGIAIAVFNVTIACSYNFSYCFFCKI